MNKKIIAYENEIEKFKEKIKVLQKKIEEEKDKEQRYYEKTVVDIVKKFYGEFSEENLKRFEKLMSSQTDDKTAGDDA